MEVPGPHTEALIVARGRAILGARGAADRPLLTYSIRKSLLSALYGMAVRDGEIDLDETLASLDVEPRLEGREPEARVRDLLAARSGVYLPALGETPEMRILKPRRHRHAPGAHWYYNNWDFNALGAIYEKRTGRAVLDDVEARIARPLGMEDFDRGLCAYEHPEDGQGHPSYHVRMSARDLWKFGAAYLRGGDPLLPRAWVEESTRTHSDARGSGGYGYLWWTAPEGRHLPGVRVPEDTFSAQGIRGQWLLVVPSRDLVVVHLVDGEAAKSVGVREFARWVAGVLE